MVVDANFVAESGTTASALAGHRVDLFLSCGISSVDRCDFEEVIDDVVSSYAVGLCIEVGDDPVPKNRERNRLNVSGRDMGEASDERLGLGCKY